MNLPGRANRNVPDEVAAGLLLAALRTCCWVNSPRAALVPATKLLNCSSALAWAAPDSAIQVAASAAPKVFFNVEFISVLLRVGDRHEDVAIAVRLHGRHHAALLHLFQQARRAVVADAQ